jgi:hypothetical protein
MWTSKIVLRSFELVSRLKVNFIKSELCDINSVDVSLLSIRYPLAYPWGSFSHNLQVFFFQV